MVKYQFNTSCKGLSMKDVRSKGE